jgi:ABC-type methionine transport system permease subunit
MIFIVTISLLCLLLNIPLGAWRARTPKFSLRWIVAVHAAVPFIILVRVLSGTSIYFIPLFVALAILGQLVGGRLQSPKKE